MKILKYLLWAVLLLIALLLIIGLFVPKKQVVKRAILIDAPSNAIFQHIAYFDKYVEWNPWLSKDPNISVSVIGEEGTVGAKRIWKSENKEVGSGEDVITAFENGALIESDLTFIEPRAGKGKNSFALSDEKNKTRVDWGLEYEMPYPFNALMIFGADANEEVGNQFDSGLKRLKDILEREERSQVNYVPSQYNFPGGNYLTIRKQISEKDLEEFKMESYSKIKNAIEEAGLQVWGHPVSLIYDWDREEKKMDVAFGVQSNKLEDVPGYNRVELASSEKSYGIIGAGSQARPDKMHLSMRNYYNTQNLEVKYPLIEEYIKGKLRGHAQGQEVVKVVYLFNENKG